MTTLLTTTSSSSTTTPNNQYNSQNLKDAIPRTSPMFTSPNTTSTTSTTTTCKNVDEFNKKFPKFSRCVSFNNLQPPEYDSDFPFNNPIYNLNQTSTISQPTTTSLFTNNYTLSSKSPQSISSAYTSTPLDEYSFGFNRKNSNPSASSNIRRKRLKLPPPPERSILKNKVSLQQLQYNDLFQDNLSEATINYHQVEENDDLADDEDTTSSGNNSPTLTATNTVPSTRRKSYAGMTDEELMALDPQFQTSKSKFNNLDKFKFDNQQTYYLSPSSRRSSTGNNDSVVAQLSKKQTYPTSNENNYKSISLTVKYGDLLQGDFKRTILTIISGRRHSWSSVDWLFSIKEDLQKSDNLLVDGDHLIVAGLIPLKFVKDYCNNKKNKASLDDYLFEKCSNLLSYLMEYISSLDLKLKVTVEFVIDYDDEGEPQSITNASKILRGDKYMLDHLFKQYQPNLIVIGNKSSNLNFKYPIKMNKLNNQYLIKISSYIVKYSTIPVILVGLDHEESRRSSIKFNKPTAISFSDKKSSTTPDSELTPKHSNSSIESVESYSPKEFTGEEKRKKSFAQKISKVQEEPYNSETKYQDWISAISDNSFQASNNYLTAINSKDDSIKVDDKIHAIYKSQTWATGNTNASHDDLSESSGGMYKVKSMISIEDDEEVKKRQELRKKKRRESQIMSIKSNDSSGVLSSVDSHNNGNNKPVKKKSFWKKLGFSKS
ncbi:hypothetical protein G210_1630 [Candida maltosa Xu316]|uniref:Uncharacterized protein n=1 Tax=Candida maltosa (strain Xu316) TaxID=1245528 RepID=M3HKG7_CANMX|nr:hypothetical protein G210_1630 [Candida maltosa Xu316]